MPRPPTLLVVLALWFAATTAQAGPEQRALLVRALLSTDSEEQSALLRQLDASEEPAVTQTLTAWRGGAVYLDESGDTPVPFLLDAQSDAEGRARGIRIEDGGFVPGPDGEPAWFDPFELTPIDADNQLRQRIKTTLDLFALDDPDPKSRQEAIIKLGQAQKPEYLDHFESRLARETDRGVLDALREAAALTQAATGEPSVRAEAIRQLGRMRSLRALSYLEQLQAETLKDPSRLDPESTRALARSVQVIRNYMAWGHFFGTAFRGLSLGAVLLVAALGLAITFGLMGIINMAHGELMMVGAYATFVTQNLFQSWFGPSGLGFDTYFIAALLASFLSAGAVGLALERGIIRFLYKRPLESLLATWGVSLVLQQLFRHVFGAANVQVSSPSWLSGSFIINDVLLAYNRLFVIGFAILIVVGTFLLLTRTSLGLQIRAVMQNRAMAAAVGVRTDRVNMLTFALGSGLAGVAGACLSQIGNVGPSLGQNYIIDCFMVVVLGGIGSLVGTVSAALGVGVTDQILQPWLGAVMGKITVLTAIILFLQWRPAGLVATRSRNLDG